MSYVDEKGRALNPSKGPFTPNQKENPLCRQSQSQAPFPPTREMAAEAQATAAGGLAGEMEVEAYRRLFPLAFLERHLRESVPPTRAAPPRPAQPPSPSPPCPPPTAPPSSASATPYDPPSRRSPPLPLPATLPDLGVRAPPI